MCAGCIGAGAGWVLALGGGPGVCVLGGWVLVLRVFAGLVGWGACAAWALWVSTRWVDKC
eukprot:361095-Chlamydomonas_euryale.AAC.9